MPATESPERGRLRWRCRRGMRELDVLLTRYLEERYDSAPLAAQRAFLELLEAPDPVIHAYCLGRALPPTAIMSAVIERITSNAAD